MMTKWKCLGQLSLKFPWSIIHHLLHFGTFQQSSWENDLTLHLKLAVKHVKSELITLSVFLYFISLSFTAPRSKVTCQVFWGSSLIYPLVEEPNHSCYKWPYAKQLNNTSKPQKSKLSKCFTLSVNVCSNSLKHKIKEFEQVNVVTWTRCALKMDCLTLQRSHEEVSNRFWALQHQVTQNQETLQNTQTHWRCRNGMFQTHSSGGMSCFTDRDDTDDGKTE